MKSAFGAASDRRLLIASILLPILPDADALLAPWIPYGSHFGGAFMPRCDARKRMKINHEATVMKVKQKVAWHVDAKPHYP
jgi:hypothetical protein